MEKFYGILKKHSGKDQTVQLIRFRKVENSGRFKHYKLIAFCLLFTAGMVGGCDYSSNTPRPFTTSPQPMVEIPTVSPVVLTEISATPSIEASSTPSPEQTLTEALSVCSDDMIILATFGSVEVDQGGILVAWPGTKADLSWRIQNSGSCIWDSVYRIEQMNTGGFATKLTEPGKEVLNDRVTPGQSITVQFEVTVPLVPADYLYSWTLINGYGNAVGEPLKVIIRVPGDAANRPLPTMTRNPNVQFEVSSTQVARTNALAFHGRSSRLKRSISIQPGSFGNPIKFLRRGRVTIIQRKISP